MPKCGCGADKQRVIVDGVGCYDACSACSPDREALFDELMSCKRQLAWITDRVEKLIQRMK